MKTKLCKIDGCNGVVIAKELCTKHYLRQRKHGSTDRPKLVREKLIEEGKSYCPKCNQTKTLDEFLKDSYTTFGISIYCKDCHKQKGKERYKLHKDKYRNYNLKKQFGISLQEYTDMFEKQGKRCAICKKENNSKTPFPLDHCHKTLKVRGILCNQCNQGLGIFYDNIETLQSAIEYLRA